MNVYARTVQRIDNVLPQVDDKSDLDKLTYIRSQITPEGQKRRDEHNTSVDHLIEAATPILRSYERQAS